MIFKRQYILILLSHPIDLKEISKWVCMDYQGLEAEKGEELWIAGFWHICGVCMGHGEKNVHL